jgi:hypothetical protein
MNAKKTRRQDAHRLHSLLEATSRTAGHATTTKPRFPRLLPLLAAGCILAAQHLTPRASASYTPNGNGAYPAFATVVTAINSENQNLGFYASGTNQALNNDLQTTGQSNAQYNNQTLANIAFATELDDQSTQWATAMGEGKPYYGPDNIWVASVNTYSGTNRPEIAWWEDPNSQGGTSGSPQEYSFFDFNPTTPQTQANPSDQSVFKTASGQSVFIGPNGDSVFQNNNSEPWYDLTTNQQEAADGVEQTWGTTFTNPDIHGSTNRLGTPIMNAQPFFMDPYGYGVFQNPSTGQGIFSDSWGLLSGSGSPNEESIFEASTPEFSVFQTPNWNEAAQNGDETIPNNPASNWTTQAPFSWSAESIDKTVWHIPASQLISFENGGGGTGGNPGGMNNSVFITDDPLLTGPNGNMDVGHSVFLDPMGNSYLDDIAEQLTLPTVGGRYYLTTGSTPTGDQEYYNTSGALTWEQNLYYDYTETTNVNPGPLTITEILANAEGVALLQDAGFMRLTAPYNFLTSSSFQMAPREQATDWYYGPDTEQGQYTNMFAQAFYYINAAGTVTPYLSMFQPLTATDQAELPGPNNNAVPTNNSQLSLATDESNDITDADTSTAQLMAQINLWNGQTGAGMQPPITNTENYDTNLPANGLIDATETPLFISNAQWTLDDLSQDNVMSVTPYTSGAQVVGNGTPTGGTGMTAPTIAITTTTAGQSDETTIFDDVLPNITPGAITAEPFAGNPALITPTILNQMLGPMMAEWEALGDQVPWLQVLGDASLAFAVLTFNLRCLQWGLAGGRFPLDFGGHPLKIQPISPETVLPHMSDSHSSYDPHDLPAPGMPGAEPIWTTPTNAISTETQQALPEPKAGKTVEFSGFHA